MRKTKIVCTLGPATEKGDMLRQLFLNGIWSPVFFGLRSPELGFIVILGLWVSIILTIAAIRRVSHTAAALLVPYAMWVSFASFLNAGIAILNP